MVKERKLFLRAKRKSERALRKQEQFQDKNEALRNKPEGFTGILTDALKNRGRDKPRVHLHLGPANSGKTYHAIESLKQSATGTYLAPLRLLAWEVADKLNAQGHPCSLLTGEENVIIPNAPYMSSTVEMFRPDLQGECIVLDEAQMLADDQRGWAWMKVLAKAESQKLEIIASPDAEKLITKILKKLEYDLTITRHERLTPLTISTKPWRIDMPSEDTIFVVFSRAGVLSLKTYFEKRGWQVSAIYGNLPPEIKKSQAARFISGESKICVATDAIGMGMNLPASKVCFTTMTKYDGQSQRTLTPAEAHQIAGRAGRYGIKESGEAGALTHDQLKVLQRLLSMKPPDHEFARVSVELNDLKKMNGPLVERLKFWEKYVAVPDELKDIVLPADMEHQMMLAGFLKEEDVDKMGLETALILIKAPVSRDAFAFWLSCVKSVIEKTALPLPLSLAQGITLNSDTLLTAENTVEQCDIYLWLSNRIEISQFTAQKENVMKYKWKLIEKIEQTLTAKSDLQQKCRKCGNKLPVLHTFNVCENCFKSGNRGFYSRRRPGGRFRFR